MSTTKKTTKKTSAEHDADHGFTADERAAMKERATELRTRRKLGSAKTDPESDVLAKIAEMAESDRVLAARLHAVIRATAPGLTPKLWYGMPAYARDGKVVCYFQSAAKFKARYATLGFSDEANLDQTTLWPVAYALTEMTADAEGRIAALVEQAVR